VGAVAEPRSFTDIEHLYCGSVYPNIKLLAPDAETALCLFCAEWFGQQDAYWLAKAGLTGMLVDRQRDKLERMQEVYPPGWEFTEADVFAFAEAAVEADLWWDVVSLDPWSSQFEECADMLPTWTTLARKVVVLGHGNYRLHPPSAPEGWHHELTLKRSDFKGGVYWLVYQRD
jgi:hypothetical protein